MLVNKQTYFKKLLWKQLESSAWSFKIYSSSGLNSDLVTNAASFVFKREFFTRLEILDLWISFYFIVASNMSLLNLL